MILAQQFDALVVTNVYYSFSSNEFIVIKRRIFILNKKFSNKDGLSSIKKFT